MAIRTKTIEYSISGSTVASAAGATTILPQLMVYIPETGSRVFRSCFVECFTEDSSSTAASITAWSLYHRVGGTGVYTTSSVTDTMANSGENMAFVFGQDATTAFSASFGQTNLSNSFDFGIALTGNSYINTYAKLTCTYEYDDAGQSRIKTVKIPMESFTGSITATGSTVIDTVPALNSYLKENGKVFRDIWFEFEGNDGTLAATVSPASASIFLDSTKVYDTGVIATTLASARTTTYIWKVPSGSLDVSTTHSVSLGSSHAQLTWDCLSVICCATYEYDHNASSLFTNCVIVPGGGSAGTLPGVTSANKDRYYLEFDIEEPQITMSRCGLYHHVASQDPLLIVPMVSSSNFVQLPVTYSFGANRVTCGESVFSTRIDSGSRQGQGIELSRGVNKLYQDWWRLGSTTLQLGSFYSSFLVLNYDSGKSSHTGGDANHNQFRKWFGFPNVADVTRYEFSSSYYTSESIYKFIGIGVYAKYITLGSGLSAAILVKSSGSDEKYDGNGWGILASRLGESDGEQGLYTLIGDGKPIFSTSLPDASVTNGIKFIPARTRQFAWETHQPSHGYGVLFGTYHTIDFSLTGSVSGFGGDGSGVPIKFYRSDTNELVTQTTSSVGGEFHTLWYDNVNTLFAEAIEDSTHVGRSANITASGNP